MMVDTSRTFVMAVDLAKGQLECVSWCEQDIVSEWVELHVDWLE